MRSRYLAPILASAIALLAAQPAQSQDLAEQLQALAEENGREYLRPITVGLGVGLTQGSYHTARPHGMLGFDLGVVAVGALIPSHAETFQAQPLGSISFGGESFQNPYGTATRTSPTAAGEGDGAVFTPQGSFRTRLQQEFSDAEIDRCAEEGGFALCFPEGLDIPAVPFGVIQAGLGVGFGTDIMIRLIPSIDIDDEIGSISAFGLGVKHSVSQYIPASPVDVAGVLTWQSMDVGTYLDASSTSFGLIASRGFGPLTLFAGGSSEHANMDVGYDFVDPAGEERRIDFSTSPSSLRFTTGLTLGLLGLNVSAAYSFADYNVLSAKLLYSFR